MLVREYTLKEYVRKRGNLKTNLGNCQNIHKEEFEKERERRNLDTKPKESLKRKRISS